PAALSPRRRLDRPQRPASGGNACRRRRTGGPDGDDPDRLRVRWTDMAAAVWRLVPARLRERLLLRELRRLLPDDRGAQGLRRGQHVAPWVARLFLSRRNEPRRRARPAPARPVRPCARRGVVPLVCPLPEEDRRSGSA